MPAPQLDGSLDAWPNLRADFSEAALLIGNGLSINVWPQFAYGSLFDYARTGGLTTEDRALFADTENFERVLSDLNTAIRVNEVLGLPADRVYERYRSIQRALGQAIRAVHLTRNQVPEATLASIRAELLNYEWIFTTSYDLLAYWAMGSGGDFNRSAISLAGAAGSSSAPTRPTCMSARFPSTSCTKPCISSSAAPASPGSCAEERSRLSSISSASRSPATHRRGRCW